MTTLTYYSPLIRKITDIFKHTNVRVAFKNTNTLQQVTKPKVHKNKKEHEKSGVHKLTCNTCKLSYIGQTSRSLQQRYKEHSRYIKQTNPLQSYALHVLNNKHEYGTIDGTMTLLKHINRSTLLLPYEQLYIQTYHHQKQLKPEQHVN